MTSLVPLGWLTLAAGMAPIPPEPMPDPLAWGYLGIRVNQGSLIISGVEPNTPAAKAGLQESDLIVRIGELEPQTFDEVAEHISTFRPGSRLKVVVRRGDAEKSYVVRLGVRPADLPPPPSSVLPIPD